MAALWIHFLPRYSYAYTEISLFFSVGASQICGGCQIMRFVHAAAATMTPIYIIIVVMDDGCALRAALAQCI